MTCQQKQKSLPHNKRSGVSCLYFRKVLLGVILSSTILIQEISSFSSPVSSSKVVLSFSPPLASHALLLVVPPPFVPNCHAWGGTAGGIRSSKKVPPRSRTTHLFDSSFASPGNDSTIATTLNNKTRDDGEVQSNIPWSVDSNVTESDNSSSFLHENKAYPQQTPHSGRHFLPSHPAYHHHPKQDLASNYILAEAND
jgi:hypothetical protein